MHQTTSRKKLDSLNNKLNGKFILHLHRSVNDMGKREISDQILPNEIRAYNESSGIDSRIENTHSDMHTAQENYIDTFED